MPWLAIGTTYSLGKLPLSPSSSPYSHPVRQESQMHTKTHTHTCVRTHTYDLPLSCPSLGSSLMTAPAENRSRESSIAS